MELEDRWGVPKRVLEAEMTASELSERMVYDNRIRISESDVLAAKFGYFLALCHCDPKHKPRFEDFLPRREVARAERRELTQEDVIAAFAGFGLKGI